MENWNNLVNAMADLDEDLMIDIIDEFGESNPTPEETQAVVSACQEGMVKVGEYYDEGDYFVADLIYAGEILANAIDKLKPLLGQSSGNKLGTIVLGTVKGDLHDIGKNIFKSLSEAGGFEVIDIGVDVGADHFIENIREHKADIVAMSGILTLAINEMKSIVEAIKDAGLNVKTIIGGNSVNEESWKRVQSDGFSLEASEGVAICRSWMS